MITSTPLTLEEFFSLPEGDRPLEFVDGRAIPKMSPKFFHSRLQKTLLLILDRWAENRGRIEPEWAIKLKKEEKNWVYCEDKNAISAFFFQEIQSLRKLNNISIYYNPK